MGSKLGSKGSQPKAKSGAPAQRDVPEGVRLQKVLADAGIASRRKAEELILERRVQLNGQTVTELGTRAIPGKDHVRVDGKLIQGAQEHRYFMLNKPRGFITTLSDPERRPTVMDLMRQSSHLPDVRLYPIGRLDYNSEGLLLMTNDGELANKLSKASSSVEKTYLVKVAGMPSDEAIDQLRRGVMIERGRLQDAGARRNRVLTAPAQVTLARRGENPWLEITLTEGRNRQIRKMLEEVGHHVEKIRRIGYGALVLDVEPGHFRELREGEVQALNRAAAGRPVQRKKVMPEAAKLTLPGKKTGKRKTFSRYKKD